MPGDSGAPASSTIYLDALMSTTLAKYEKTLKDNIFKKSAFLAYLREAGAVKSQNGGQRIVVPLMYGTNSTVKTHGGYSTIDTTPQEGITSAEYNWAEVAGSISISRLEERQNAGEGRLINLLESKMKQAEMTMQEKLNSDLLLGTVSSATFVPDQASSGAYGLLPLGYFFRKLKATNPTTGGNVGNINAATNDWWRHIVGVVNNASVTNADFTLNISTYAGVKAALKRFYNYLSRGSGGSPDLFVGDQVTYETYEASLDANLRYSNTKMADMGFDTIKVKGATFIWDEVTPDVYTGTAAITTGTVFGLNTEFYQLYIDSETDIKTTPFVEPNNQTVKTAKVLFMGNAVVSNMKKNGVCIGFSQSIMS